MIQRPYRLAAVITLLVVAASGCTRGGSPDAGAPDRCALKIGIFGPLSGSSADLGGNIRDGAGLAVDGYDTAHPNCPVTLLELDSQADPKLAPNLAQQAVADRQVIGIVGPAFSGESHAASPLLDQGGLPAITASATEASLSSQGWTTFHRILGNDAAQGPAAGRYIRDILKARKVFVVDDGGAYGHGLAGEVIDELGPLVAQTATIPPDQREFSTLIGQIQAARPDAVYFGGYYDQAGSLLRQLRQGGVRATFVGGDGIKDPGFIRSAGPDAEGTIITCPCRPPETAGADFDTRYRARFGRPPGTYSAEAYDAASVFLTGIGAGMVTRPRMATFVSGFTGTGVTGPIQFDPHGDLVASSVEMWTFRVHGGAIVTDQRIPRE